MLKGLFSFYFGISVTISVLLLVTGCAGNKVAEAKYTVVEKDGRFELRNYESQIVAETVVDADFEEAGNEAFKRLFSYISGNNKPAGKIAMTAPVSQRPVGVKINMSTSMRRKLEKDKWVVSFMMPSSYTMDTIPQPKDSRIVLRQMPARRFCAVSYSGRWTQENYRKYKIELENWMRRKKIKSAGEAIWARYNPPWTLWFLKRNEILYPVNNDKDTE
jgi:hypothetical protein